MRYGIIWLSIDTCDTVIDNRALSGDHCVARFDDSSVGSGGRKEHVLAHPSQGQDCYGYCCFDIIKTKGRFTDYHELALAYPSQGEEGEGVVVVVFVSTSDGENGIVVTDTWGR